MLGWTAIPARRACFWVQNSLLFSCVQMDVAVASIWISYDLISLHLHKWVCQTQLDSLLKEQGVANACQASTITKTSNAPPHFLRQRFKHQTRRSELAELQGSVQEGFTAAIVFVQTLGGKRQSYTLRALQYAMGISWNIISHSQHIVCASCAGPCGSKIQ
jgi:hypothetical protein